ncbi:sufE-like protein 1, chloroplastic/mitochondrial [Punica granatum]|uniref:Fe-S metabolism associated domain-containing protein n=2 Tax=Punica granatum TaxID=22663 RepID=A0A218XMA5_PUNGR|nr:sufE-like protein 1, chloroplastic/mitochondrial [Punica granatum]OWM85908.1 hypothetical protein CDL15_Pgr012158 [Punica granatum]PKI31285.1 hypothetical protein CRG98_048320 [Punica granatum]
MASSATSSLSLRFFFTKKLSAFTSPSSFPSPRALFLSPSRPFSISFQRIQPTTKSSASSPPSTGTSASLQPIEELPPNLQQIVALFQSVPDPKSKYQQLLFYGKNLNPLDPRFKTRENKVEGCVSQVWVRAYLDPGKNVVFEADSDSVLTKGLAALLVQGLSGSPVDKIIRVSPDFITLLGLQQSLTPSRNNGFLNMLRLMQKKALLLLSEGENGGTESKSDTGADGSPVSEPKFDVGSDKSSVLEAEKDEIQVNSDVGTNGSAVAESKASTSGAGTEASSGLGSRGQRIKEILEREFSPTVLELEDISYQHAGHAGARGSDGETHFNLRVVSKEFEGKSLVKRHRLVYDLLKEELQNGLHALSIVAKTPSEV